MCAPNSSCDYHRVEDDPHHGTSVIAISALPDFHDDPESWSWRLQSRVVADSLDTEFREFKDASLSQIRNRPEQVQLRHQIRYPS